MPPGGRKGKQGVAYLHWKKTTVHKPRKKIPHQKKEEMRKKALRNPKCREV